MALQWKWSEKCGEAIFTANNGDETKTNLYQGNAYLIFLYETEEKGEKNYCLYTFWADKAHMKNCLGLEKNYDNIYSTNPITSIKINKKKCKNYIDIVKALVKSFDNIQIEIFSD